jgi:hypothetical protein
MLKVRSSQQFARFAVGLCLALLPAAALAQARQTGTVKAIDDKSVTVTTATGPVVVAVAPDATVVQVAPDAKNLTAAVPVKLSDIVVGDKVITGKVGDTDTASRVVVLKSADIAARNAAESADWQKRGAGGLVKAVDGSTITITAGLKSVKVETTPKTVFRRYAADSIKFQDATAGQLAQVKAGDQLSVRGDKSADGSSITAEEVVTGTFANLSGLLTAVSAADGKITFKDLTTKKTVTVLITANSDVRNLPAAMAARFAPRAPGAAGDAAGGGAPGGSAPGGGAPGGGQRGPGGAGGQGGGPGGPGGGRGNAGADLSRMLTRLPQITVADLKPTNAVMIVASPGSEPGTFTAITVLSGVDALLTAPAGAAPVTLAPWNIGGGGAPE